MPDIFRATIRGLRFLAVVFSLAALSGCDDVGTADGGHKNSQAAQSPKPRIALVMKTLTNPFFIAMEKGAREAEEEFGIGLIVRTATQETSIAQQIEIVSELVREKSVDAIVIAPGDSIKLIPSLKEAQNNGIVVVNIDNQLDPDFSKKYGLVDVPFISVDNEAGAYISTKRLIESTVGPINAAILEGIRSAKNSEDRFNGAMRAIREYDRVTLVAAETANWKIDEAYNVAKAMFTKHPEINVLFCANDMMALGALKYLDDTRNESVQVGGYDALKEAKESIREGKMRVTIDQKPERQGYLGIRYAVQMLNGETPPMKTLVDVVPVTIENL